jgi:hypothetical protein
LTKMKRKLLANNESLKYVRVKHKPYLNKGWFSSLFRWALWLHNNLFLFSARRYAILNSVRTFGQQIQTM